MLIGSRIPTPQIPASPYLLNCHHHVSDGIIRVVILGASCVLPRNIWAFSSFPGGIHRPNQHHQRHNELSTPKVSDRYNIEIPPLKASKFIRSLSASATPCGRNLRGCCWGSPEFLFLPTLRLQISKSIKISSPVENSYQLRTNNGHQNPRTYITRTRRPRSRYGISSSRGGR